MKKWDVLFWVFLIIALILLIWAILGRSPSMETIIAAMVASNAALWAKIYDHGKELTKISVKLDILRGKMDRAYTSKEHTKKR